MHTTVRWGLLLAAVNAGLLLVGHNLGYQGERVSSGGWLYVPVYLGMFAVTGLGVRAARRRLPETEVTFGRGVLAGLKVAVFGGIVAGGYAYLHFRYLATGYADHLVAHVRTAPAFQGLGPSDVAAVENLLRAAYSPGGLALASPVVNVIVGTLGALLASAVWCRPRSRRT